MSYNEIEYLFLPRTPVECRKEIFSVGRKHPLRRLILVSLLIVILATACSESQAGRAIEDSNKENYKGVILGPPHLEVWEKSEAVRTGESQIIYVSLFAGDQSPSGAVYQLSVTYPDGSQSVYYLSPTDDNGKSSIELKPITAPNLTLIIYQVCVINRDNIPCVTDHFLIWE